MHGIAAALRDRRRASGRDLFRIRQRRAALYHGRLGKAASTLWPQNPDRHLAVAARRLAGAKWSAPANGNTSTTPWGDRDELYDLVADPNELVNVIDEEQHRDALAAMRLRLADWSINTEDGQPVPLPDCTHYELV